MFAEFVLGMVSLVSLAAGLLGTAAVTAGPATVLQSIVVGVSWLLFVVSFAAGLALRYLRRILARVESLDAKGAPPAH